LSACHVDIICELPEVAQVAR